ncbi:hypothetical protein Tco_1440191 [Tanacetum coccineum]
MGNTNTDQIPSPLMLDSYTSNMCMQSWGRSSGKKKQVAIACKEVSNSNPFDVLNSVERDDDLGTNVGGGGIQSRIGMGLILVSPTEYTFFNFASSSSNTTLIVERINKIERQIIDGKLTLVDDDEKPVPKVVSTKIVDSNSEVEDVVDDHAIFMTSTG